MSKKIIKVKLKDLQIQGDHNYSYEKDIHNKIIPRKKRGVVKTIVWFILGILGISMDTYDWKKLKKSIEENGYDPQKFQYIQIVETTSFKRTGISATKFPIVNGNHRVFLLKKMFGEDYEIEVEFNKNILAAINPKNIFKKRKNKEPKKPRLPFKDRIFNILEKSILIVPTLYLFIFHFIETMAFVFLTYLVYVNFNSALKLKPLKEYDNGIINVVLKNLYYNQRLIFGGIAVIIFTFYFLFTDLLGFILISSYSLIMPRILRKLNPESYSKKYSTTKRKK